MEIIDLAGYNEIRFHTAVALGNFDGIHIGHRKLIKKMVSKAKKLGLKSSLLLFKNHTKSITNSEEPKTITNNQQKIEIIKELGVDIVYMLDFNENIMRYTGEEFIKEIIISKMNGKLVVVGFDYKFGYKASSNADDLRKLGKRYDMDVIVLDPILENELIVSSSQIRHEISQGNIKKIIKILGRPYTIMGKVIPGENRGNKLGFPTANIDLVTDYVLPKNGVYATNTIIDGKKYLSATNIGFNPTFNEDKLKIETHILDFKDNIYNKNISVEFIEFIREDIKFDSKEDLIQQMKMDIINIKNGY